MFKKDYILPISRSTNLPSYPQFSGGSCCSLRQIVEDYRNGLLNSDVGKVEKKRLAKLRYGLRSTSNKLYLFIYLIYKQAAILNEKSHYALETFCSPEKTKVSCDW